MKDYTHGPRPGFWLMLWRTGGLFPLVLAVVAVVLSFSSFGNLKTGLEFQAEGVDTIADVVDRRTRRVGNAEQRKTEYLIELRYVVDRNPVLVERKVPRKVYEASEIGSTREVRYLPRKPKRLELEVGETLANGKLARWVALGFGVASLLALWWKGMRAVDAIRARKFGAAERATVIDVLEHRGKKSVSYRLQWFDKDGTIGTSLSSGRRDRFAPYPRHTSIEVFRGAKGHVWWVGDVGPRERATTVPSVGKS